MSPIALELSGLDLGGMARNLAVVMVLPWARREASASQMGKSLLGLIHLKLRSRLKIRWLSSQARRRGPKLAGRGMGSIRVRLKTPPGIRQRFTAFKIVGTSDDDTRDGRLREYAALKRQGATGKVEYDVVGIDIGCMFGNRVGDAGFGERWYIVS